MLEEKLGTIKFVQVYMVV